MTSLTSHPVQLLLLRKALADIHTAQKMLADAQKHTMTKLSLTKLEETIFIFSIMVHTLHCEYEVMDLKWKEVNREEVVAD